MRHEASNRTKADIYGHLSAGRMSICPELSGSCPCFSSECPGVVRFCPPWAAGKEAWDAGQVDFPSPISSRIFDRGFGERFLMNRLAVNGERGFAQKRPGLQ